MRCMTRTDGIPNGVSCLLGSILLESFKGKSCDFTLYSSANVPEFFLTKTIVWMLMGLVMSCVLNVIAYMIYTCTSVVVTCYVPTHVHDGFGS